ncbi:sugar porter family MFS transporter [Rouxiella badensis]|jgi:SP family xylose:H+ symportor-like MFS transporter|uniref:sugar porter family MFS transporter n=1 Tax=Rouxiella badensis TaxID=1646377 RepID=UPI003C4F33EC
MATNKTHYNLVYLMLCCTVAAFGGLLMGYDSSIISGAIEPLSTYFQLGPAETGWAVSCIQVSSLIGCLVAPKISDHFGRKRSLCVTAIIFAVSIVGTALAHNFTVFILFRLIGGLAIGLACVISPIYLAELSPSRYRGRTTALYSICCVGGQSVVMLTNFFISKSMTSAVLVDTGWRLILSSALVPCIALLVFISFIPESPRWSVFKGRDKEALTTLGKISNLEHAKTVFGEIKDSIKTDIHSTVKAKFTLNKKTFPLLIIGIGLALGNQLSGVNVIQYFGPTLMKNISSDNNTAMFLAFVLAFAQFLGVVVGMFLLDKVGRRKLLLWGALASTVCLAYSFAAFYLRFAGVYSVLGLFAFMFLFGITWGQVIWTVLGEIFPMEIRSICVGISVCSLSVANFAVSTTFPIMNSNPYLQQVFHGGFPLLLFSGFSLLMFLFTYRYVPETANVPLERIEAIVLRKYYGRDIEDDVEPVHGENIGPLGDGIK